MGIEKRLIQNNYTSGRFGYRIRRIVLHTYGGGGRSLFNWFNAPTTQASAHYAIFKDGNGEQYVEDGNMAWHAGTSAGGGLPNNNWESIGIEHQDDANPGDAGRTNELYEASAQLVATLCRRHGIPCRLLSDGEKWGDGITIHRQYANKYCPGALDAQRIVNRANEILNPAPAPDDLYRVMNGTAQVGAYKEKDNAFNIWYDNKSYRVRFKNSDITSDFQNMANKLEQQITSLTDQVTGLNSQVSKLQSEKESLSNTITSLNTSVGNLKVQVNELTAERDTLKTERDTAVEFSNKFQKSFFGQLYLLFTRKNGQSDSGSIS